MYLKTIVADLTSQAPSQHVMSPNAAVAASSARSAGVHTCVTTVACAGAVVRSAAAGGLGGDAVAKPEAPWARPRLVEQPGGGVSIVEQASVLLAIDEVKARVGGVSAMTESTIGLFNPQYYRDFRTWSPPN